jgi:hypothetical protein
VKAPLNCSENRTKNVPKIMNYYYSYYQEKSKIPQGLSRRNDSLSPASIAPKKYGAVTTSSIYHC